MSEFLKGVLCLGLTIILFLIADYLQVDNLKDLF